LLLDEELATLFELLLELLIDELATLELVVPPTIP